VFSLDHVIKILKENVTIVLEVYVLLTKDQMGKVSIYISFFSNLIYNVYACNTKSFIPPEYIFTLLLCARYIEYR
jgi:hypothetical protein